MIFLRSSFTAVGSAPVRANPSRIVDGTITRVGTSAAYPWYTSKVHPGDMILTVDTREVELFAGEPLA